MKICLLPVWLLVICLCSCSHQKIEFEKESGKTNKIELGKKFYISLPEDHKTNYYWGVSHEYDKKVLSYIRSVFHGTTVEFHFVATGKGRTEINFSLNGYKNVADTKTFVVEVE